MAKKKIDITDIAYTGFTPEGIVNSSTKKTKKVKADVSDQQQFADDMSSFLETSCGLEIQTLDERDEINYWINSGSYALNWIICDSFFEGLPGSKAILLAGECLGPDCEITVKVPKKIAELLI